MVTQIIPHGYLRDVRFDGNFAEVNYSAGSDVCGLIFAKITTSSRAWHVIFVTIFRALFLAPGSFVSLTDIRFREFQLSRGIYRGAREWRGLRTAMQFSALHFTAIDCHCGLNSGPSFVQKYKSADRTFYELVVLHSTRSLLHRHVNRDFILPPGGNSADLHSAGGKGRHWFTFNSQGGRLRVINDHCSSSWKISFPARKALFLSYVFENPNGVF